MKPARRMPDMSRAQPSVRQLGEELFRTVQGAQGFAFISDGIGDLPDHDSFFGVVRNALRHNRRATEILRHFLRKHDPAFARPCAARSRRREAA